MPMKPKISTEQVHLILVTKPNLDSHNRSAGKNITRMNQTESDEDNATHR
jgi:hypothetical protein